MDIYLDHNATTAPDPAVVRALLPHLQDRFGNAASAHPRGRAAAKAVEEAREKVATLLSVPAGRVVWTSGATEALNTALKGLADVRGDRHRLLVAATEHKAVLDTAQWLSEHRGVEVDTVPVGRDGSVDLRALEEMLADDVLAVAVMAANNETGAINPTEAVADRVRTAGAAYVCDATQLAGKLPCDLSTVDYAAVSAHKMYGPQGVGALIVPSRGQADIEALIHGGGHEKGLRSGTLNLPGIVGFGAAAEIAASNLPEEQAQVAALRDRLEELLTEQVGRVEVHAASGRRLPNTTCVRIEEVDADALIVAVPDVAFSSGSACTSSVPSPSHVLLAMGVPQAAAEQSVRLSLGRYTTADEIAAAVERISSAVVRLRELEGVA